MLRAGCFDLQDGLFGSDVKAPRRQAGQLLATQSSQVGQQIDPARRSSSGSMSPFLRSLASRSILAASSSVADLSVKPLSVRRRPLWSSNEKYQNGRRLSLSRPRLKTDDVEAKALTRLFRRSPLQGSGDSFAVYLDCARIRTCPDSAAGLTFGLAVLRFARLVESVQDGGLRFYYLAFISAELNFAAFRASGLLRIERQLGGFRRLPAQDQRCAGDNR